MSTLVRSIPTAITENSLLATPFRVIIPRQLDREDAMAVYEALKSDPNIKLQDPFFLADVSSVFPGVRYDAESWAMDLQPVANIIDALSAEDDELTHDFPDYENPYTGAFVEVDVPEALEDVAEALAVDDLTQPPTN